MIISNVKRVESSDDNVSKYVFDIGGGCGQLFHTQQWMKSHPEFARPSVGMGHAVVHMPTVC